MMLRRLFLLAFAGALGTLARYAFSGLVQRTFDGGFPVGTLAVNVLGCFLFGIVWTLAEERLIIGGETRFILLVGFMGAFTTFSTYGYETSAMLRDAEWPVAAMNILTQNVLGIASFFIGAALGRLV